MTCETTVRVRYAETDQMGVTYHANYFVWMEIGRTELIRRSGISYKRLEEEGYMLPLSKCFARFVGSALYDEEIVVASAATELGATKLRIDYRMRKAATGEPVAEGFTEHALVDARTRKIVRMPDFLRQGIVLHGDPAAFRVKP